MTNIEQVHDDGAAESPACSLDPAAASRAVHAEAGRPSIRLRLLGTLALLSSPFTATVLAFQGSAGGAEGTGESSAFPSRAASTATKGKKERPPGGATVGTEEAVLEGLRWLLRHQNEDGSWGTDSLKSHCSPGKACIPVGARIEPRYNEGLTGLALLAFLGQGISVASQVEIEDTVTGKHHAAGDVVAKGIQWLLARQREDGALGDPDFAYAMYDQALATMALCEAYGISRKRELEASAQRAVDFLVAAQKLDKSGSRWGWRYLSKKHLDDKLAAKAITRGQHDELVEDVDMSVTNWAVMALKSAQLVGLSVPDEVMEGALAYARYTTGKEGLVGYKSPYGAGERLSGPGDQFTYHTGTMSALGMLVRTFTQHDGKDPFLEQAAKLIAKDPPSVSKDKLSIDYYYWYHAALALNQFDGPDSPRKATSKYWQPWNRDLISALLSLQDKTKAPGVCNRGGWLEDDRWGQHTGHALYSTALNVLTLEVYYRYENAFE